MWGIGLEWWILYGLLFGTTLWLIIVIDAGRLKDRLSQQHDDMVEIYNRLVEINDTLYHIGLDKVLEEIEKDLYRELETLKSIERTLEKIKKDWLNSIDTLVDRLDSLDSSLLLDAQLETLKSIERTLEHNQ